MLDHLSSHFDIDQCNISQIIGESNRFLFHVFLVHISTCLIDGKKSFFSEELFKTLLITFAAIALYHIFFRKIIEPKIEKMKLICYSDNTERSKKQQEIYSNIYGSKKSGEIPRSIPKRNKVLSNRKESRRNS